MQLFCRKCETVVSNPLQELLDHSQLNETDREEYIPKGFYIINDGAYFSNSVGNLLMNNADLVNCKDHPDGGRLNGCCGMDGLDGPNKVCINGHEIGTEISDCWIANVFLFEKDTVNSLGSFT